MSNQGNQSRYGKLYTADEEGNRRSFVGFINEVRGKNALIVLSSLLRMTIYTVSMRTMETSSADSTFAQHVDAE